jgi:hypothetical protein
MDVGGRAVPGATAELSVERLSDATNLIETHHPKIICVICGKFALALLLVSYLEAWSDWLRLVVDR